MQREFISALAEKINKKSNFTVWFNGNLHLNEKNYVHVMSTGKKSTS